MDLAIYTVIYTAPRGLLTAHCSLGLYRTRDNSPVFRPARGARSSLSEQAEKAEAPAEGEKQQHIVELARAH